MWDTDQILKGQNINVVTRNVIRQFDNSNINTIFKVTNIKGCFSSIVGIGDDAETEKVTKCDPVGNLNHQPNPPNAVALAWV